MLDDKPLSALRYARGLADAARAIASVADVPVANSRRRLAAHRSFDVALSALSLVYIAPLFAVLALFARLDRGSGPVLARSARLGKDGRVFYQLRFATRLRESGRPGTVTRIGALLDLDLALAPRPSVAGARQRPPEQGECGL